MAELPIPLKMATLPVPIKMVALPIPLKIATHLIKILTLPIPLKIVTYSIKMVPLIKMMALPIKIVIDQDGCTSGKKPSPFTRTLDLMP
jgi:hypothetical protein